MKAVFVVVNIITWPIQLLSILVFNLSIMLLIKLFIQQHKLAKLLFRSGPIPLQRTILVDLQFIPPIEPMLLFIFYL